MFLTMGKTLQIRMYVTRLVEKNERWNTLEQVQKGVMQFVRERERERIRLEVDKQ